MTSIYVNFFQTGKWLDMLDIDDDLSKKEPDLDKCRTERVVNNISICLVGNDKCRYALAATYAKAYCLHPKHASFRKEKG
ncbi:MAG: hypothetical protein CXR30_19255 [Geobacter sp.]|nr:MAG: hypothetical protein CXR30_19255 [Geobacter sp.]